jgi:predicted Mrr-cat superfamily restriction endonuclease
MGRGDYRTKYKKGKYSSMPVARDTAFAEKTVPEEVFEDNWKKVFKNTTPLKQLNQKHECTCNLREEKTDRGLYLVEDPCKQHKSKGFRKLVKITDPKKGFGKFHMSKVRKIMYGNGDVKDIRQVTDRNG